MRKQTRMELGVNTAFLAVCPSGLFCLLSIIMFVFHPEQTGRLKETIYFAVISLAFAAIALWSFWPDLMKKYTSSPNLS